jgi:hypothetical protein
MLHSVRDRREWLERKAALADRSPMFALPVHNVKRRGPLPVADESPQVSDVGRARRRLARMLADELVNPPVPHVVGHDLLSA